MPKCADCKLVFNNTEFHHDPPKSRTFISNNKKYYVDVNGKVKVLIKTRNRHLCYSCHDIADRMLKLPVFNSSYK